MMVGQIDRFARFFLFIMCLLLMQTAAFSAQLFPIKAGTNGLYGYINKAGHLVIEPQYSDAGIFNQGFAPVCQDGGWFFINEEGINAFAEAFMEIKGFNEGLAAVKDEIGWGYIDLKGKLAIPYGFLEAYDFSEGLACVLTGKREDNTAKYGYIDPKGNFALKPFLSLFDNQYFSHPGKFSEGLASAWIGSGQGDERIGYFDKSGETIISPAYNEAGDFCEGLAPVSNGEDDQGSSSGFINKDGTYAIKPIFSRTGNFRNGLAPACKVASAEGVEDQWGFVDKIGKWVIDPKFIYAEPFYNGLARVYLKTFDNEAYIDEKGRIVADSKIEAEKTVGIKIKPVKIKCSSMLPPSKSGKTDYRPENILDGDPSTAWIEGSKGEGSGEWVELHYANVINFTRISIWSGYQKKYPSGKSSFKSNLRPKAVKISCDEKAEKEILLADELGEQSFELGLKGKSIRLTIMDIYRDGKEDPDCGFSEISISGSAD